MGEKSGKTGDPKIQAGDGRLCEDQTFEYGNVSRSGRRPDWSVSIQENKGKGRGGSGGSVWGDYGREVYEVHLGRGGGREGSSSGGTGNPNDSSGVAGPSVSGKGG